MAFIASDHHKSGGLSAAALLAPFRAVGRFMIMLAESTSHARALNQLSEVSDEDLAAKGVTRTGEIRRILGASATI